MHHQASIASAPQVCWDTAAPQFLNRLRKVRLFPVYRQLVALYSAYRKRVGDISSVVVRARDDLTLFCDIYNVFLMFLIDFFVLNSNPMSASFKSLSIFVDSRSKVNIKVKYDFLRNEARNKCNT